MRWAGRADAVGQATVVTGDCHDVLRHMDDGSVDAVVTDPPWNLGRDYGRHDDAMPLSTYVRWLNGILRECGRVSRGSVMILIGAVNLPRIPALLAGTGLGVKGILPWHRAEGAWEAIAWTASLDAAPPGVDVDPTARRVLSDPALAVPTDVDHPCPKPLAVASALVDLAAPAHGTVLDPFVGTGTILVAASRSGRPSIGIELEPRFAQQALDRLRASS